MARGLGAGLVEVLQGRARQLELARGLEADRPVRAGQRDHIAVLDHRLPAEFRQPHQQVADAVFFVVARRPVVRDPKDELLMLGADAPVVGRLLAALEHRQQVGAALDRSAVAGFGTLGHLSGGA